MKHTVFQALADAAQRPERAALAVVTGVRGSSPQKIGAKALFHGDGRILGTIGGGCLEAEVQRRAVQSLETGQPATFELALNRDYGWDDALLCGGTVCGVILPDAVGAGAALWAALAARERTTTWGVRRDFAVLSVTPGVEAADWLYQETVGPPCALWIAGAGHIAQAVAPLALGLDFSVTVFDDRPALANHQHFPGTVQLQVADWDTLLATPLPSAPAFGLIVTRGQRHDTLTLQAWIQRPFVFLGMIGSQRKARAMTERFLRENLATPDQIQRVVCPVGLPIKAVSVPEIAVSVLAQLIERRAACLPGPGQLGPSVAARAD
jgi:xanthine dehydrogenase accessory factor